MRPGAESPRVSVLMPVHNSGAFLDEALESLAAQTWRDFEVIAVDDASSDESPSRLRGRARSSPWLRIVTRGEQGGVAAALNTGLGFCRGELVARMDADDVASADRLAKQVEFFFKHPEVGLCGGAAKIFGGDREELVRPPAGDDDIRAWLVFGSAFVHPTVMFRREVLEKAGGRYTSVTGVEDYDLWLKMAEVARLANLPDELLRYRMHAGQYTAAKRERHYQELDRLRLGWLVSKGIRADEGETRAHRAVGFDRPPGDLQEPGQVAAWLRRLLRELPTAGWCEQCSLRAMVAERWWAWMLHNGGGPAASFAYLNGPVARIGRRELRRAVRLMAGRGLARGRRA